MIAAAQAMLAAGGEVWVADETALREFPPLRASWSRCGQPATVLISGRNRRRTIVGALQVSTGELVTIVRERCRTEEIVGAMAGTHLAKTSGTPSSSIGGRLRPNVGTAIAGVTQARRAILS